MSTHNGVSFSTDSTPIFLPDRSDPTTYYFGQGNVSQNINDVQILSGIRLNSGSTCVFGITFTQTGGFPFEVLSFSLYVDGTAVPSTPLTLLSGATVSKTFMLPVDIDKNSLMAISITNNSAPQGPNPSGPYGTCTAGFHVI